MIVKFKLETYVDTAYKQFENFKELLQRKNLPFEQLFRGGQYKVMKQFSRYIGLYCYEFSNYENPPADFNKVTIKITLNTRASSFLQFLDNLEKESPNLGINLKIIKRLTGYLTLVKYDKTDDCYEYVLEEDKNKSKFSSELGNFTHPCYLFVFNGTGYQSQKVKGFDKALVKKRLIGSDKLELFPLEIRRSLTNILERHEVTFRMCKDDNLFIGLVELLIQNYYDSDCTKYKITYSEYLSLVRYKLYSFYYDN